MPRALRGVPVTQDMQQPMTAKQRVSLPALPTWWFQ